MNQFERLPPDVIIYMAMNMDLPEILSFCLLSKRFDGIICQNKDFWLHRLINDYEVDVSEIPSHYTPKMYYEYMVNHKLRFFIPTPEQRCEETAYFNKIQSDDFIIGYGTPYSFVCYKLDELINLIESIPINDRSLKILKSLLQDTPDYSENEQKKLLVKIINDKLLVKI